MVNKQTDDVKQNVKIAHISMIIGNNVKKASPSDIAEYKKLHLKNVQVNTSVRHRVIKLFKQGN